MMAAAPAAIASAPNFRDLGGWRSADGRQVRSGLVFRSEALLAPTETDADTLRAKGIVLVCDLRSDSERVHGPNRFWEERNVERLTLDLLAAIPEDQGPWPILRTRPDAAGARAAMRAVYAAMPGSSAPLLGTLFRRIGAGDLPMLVHCTAGKDRTGFVSAILLLALGVERADVVKDYLQSRGRWTDRAAEATRAMVHARAGHALDAAALEAMMGVEEEYLDASLASIASTYGDIEAYLAAAGLDAPLLGRLRDRLLG